MRQLLAAISILGITFEAIGYILKIC